MLTIHISEDDATILCDAIESLLSDLRTEIGHTENLAYREELKAKKRSLRRVLEQIAVPVAV